MKKIKILLTLIIAVALCGCNDDDEHGEKFMADTVTLNVDVILPTAIHSQWQPSIDWALENIATAQRQQSQRVKLNLRFHDEDTEDLDALAYQLTHPKADDDTCDAIIGPYHSYNAETILRYANEQRLPVVMPTCTSSELQRTNARSTNAWFLTESDVTQCEMLMAGAATLGQTDAVLVYSDDSYGQSFRDWFGYYATEQQVHLAGSGICAYTGEGTLRTFLNGAVDDCQSGRLLVCIALGRAADYERVCEQVRQWTLQQNSNGSDGPAVSVILTDTALEEQLLQKADDLWFSYGLSPTASPDYGFSQMYEARVGSQCMNGSAQMYDALTLLALGAAHQLSHSGTMLTDHMRSIVASESGQACGWDAANLARAFANVAAGRDIVLTGASGPLNFDSETHTKVLNTCYMLWQLDDVETGYRVKPLFYISTEGSSTQASTTSLWEMDKLWSQTFTDDNVNHQLPAVTDRWAVVISPSTTWSNYRHQADAFAMYQTLRHHGYDDDHIVLIVEDNLANDERNLFPGEIYVERSDAASNDPLVNDNVRKNAVVDYHFSDLRPADLASIMTGQQSDRLPHVIRPTETSNVFFFWSGHGGQHEGPLWGNETDAQYFGTARIRDIVARMDYRRMMLAIETCYSGRWGEALLGLPDVLVLTAANSQESSKADMHDAELGVYLSNAFARTFRRQINTRPAISIYDLYRELFRTTRGSHVSIYNQQQYGSVYRETMQEFLPE